MELNIATNPYALIAIREARKYGVPPQEILGIMNQESLKYAANKGINPNEATSYKGAAGLMQLMPATFAQEASSIGIDNPDIRNPAHNIAAGVAYYAKQRKKFAKGNDISVALAAYNAGPGNVAKYNNTVPPFGETQKYIPLVNEAAAEFATQLQALPQDFDVDGTLGSLGYGQAASVGTSVGGEDIAAGLRNAQSTLGDVRNSLQTQLTGQQTAAADLPAVPEAPDFQGAATGGLSALRAQIAKSRGVVNKGLGQLEQRDLQARGLRADLYQRYDYDPRNPNSVWSQNIQRNSNISGRLGATIDAEQRFNDATVFDNPSDFISGFLFGNPYSQGRKDLVAQSNALRTVNDNVSGDIAKQVKVSESIELSNPALIEKRMDAELKFLDAEKSLAIKEAELPVEVYNAKIGAYEQEVKAMQLRMEAANLPMRTQLKIAEVAVKEATLQQQIAKIPADAAKAEAEKVQAQLLLFKLKTEQDYLAENPESAAKDLAASKEADRKATQARTVQSEQILQDDAQGLNTLRRDIDKNTLEGQQRLAPITEAAAYQNALAQHRKAIESNDPEVIAAASVEVENARRRADIETKQLEEQQAQFETQRQISRDQQTAAAINAKNSIADAQVQADTAEERGEAFKRQVAEQATKADVDAKRADAFAEGLLKIGANKAVTQDTFKNSPTIIDGIAKIADGKMPGNNAMHSSIILSAVGATATDNEVYPLLGETASSVMAVGAQLLGDVSQRELNSAAAQLPSAPLAKAIAKQSPEGRDVTSNLRRGGGVYALPSNDIILNELTGSDSYALLREATDSFALDTAESAADIVQAIVKTKGANAQQKAKAVASYFQTAISYNNSSRGYEHFGIAPMTADSFTMEVGSLVKPVNLLSTPEVTRYIMRAARGALLIPQLVEDN